MNLFENIVNRKPVFANKDFRNTTDAFGSASGFFWKTPTTPQTYTQKAPTQFWSPTPIVEKPKMTLFSDEYTMLGKMKADWLSDDESMNLITQRRKDLLNGKVMIDAQEKEMLRKMQADNVSAKEATAMIAQRRKDKEKEQFNKAYESGNLLQKGAYNFLALWAGNLETIAKYSGNALDFATGWKLGFWEEVKKMEEVTQSPQFQESTAFKAGTYLPDVALAVSPIWAWYMAGAKWMTGLQWANLFSKVGLKNVSQWLMARSWVVGAGFWATQPIFEKWSEATVWDIASWAGYWATFWALWAPVFGKAFKYGQAGYYGWATGMGKSIARDIKWAWQTAKTIGNAIKPSGANISTRANRFNGQDEEKFIQATWQTPWEFATTRGMTKVGDDAVVEATNAWQASTAQADEAFWAIEGNFRIWWDKDFINWAIEWLQWKLSKYSPEIERVNQLALKYQNEWLTMSEVNELKRLYSANHKYSFLDSGSKQAIESRDIQDWLRTWQFKVAEENGLANIADINKNTQAWKMYADSLAKKLNRWVANNENTLTDWIVLWGGSPENIALYLGKKLASSDLAKRTAIKLFSKQTKPSIIKANKAEIQQSNFQKNVNRGISGNRDSSGGESMVRVKWLLPAGTKEAKIAQEEAIARQKAKKESTEQAKAILAKQKAQEEALKSPDITSKSIIRQPEWYTKKVTPTPVKEVTPEKVTPTEKVEPKKVETNITRNEAIEKWFSDSAKARWNKWEFTSKERWTATTYLKSNYKGKEYTIDWKKYKVKSIDNRNEQVNLEDSNGNILRVKTNKLPETKVTDSDISNYYNGRLQKGYRTIKDPTKTTVNLQQSKGGFIRLPEIGKKSVLDEFNNFKWYSDWFKWKSEVMSAIEDIGGIDNVKRTTLKITDIKPTESYNTANEWVKRVMEEIKAGNKIPIIVDEIGEIIDWNHRYSAYKALGITDIPVISPKNIVTPKKIEAKVPTWKNIEIVQIPNKGGYKIQDENGYVYWTVRTKQWAEDFKAKTIEKKSIPVKNPPKR